MTVTVDAPPAFPPAVPSRDDQAPVGAPSAPEAVVRLRGVSKSFPIRRSAGEVMAAARHWPPRWPHAVRRTVLSHVDLVAHRGECLGLLGPNGAGKTTIFRLVAGMVLPSAGEIEVLGDVVDADHRGARATRARVAYASVDERTLYWRLSATENVALYVALYGARGDEARRRVADSLALVGLARAGDQAVGSFSSGMRQRLLIARALAQDPQVLLLDEPTRSLDPMTARDLRRFLREEVVERRACTVLLATHNSDEAMELCDRVAVLDRGRLVAVDRARTLAARVGDDRLTVFTSTPRHPAFAELHARGLVSEVAVGPAATEPPRAAAAIDGSWVAVTLRVDGGEPAAAAVIEALAARGVAVSRVERTPVGLAELIERATAGGAR